MKIHKFYNFISEGLVDDIKPLLSDDNRNIKEGLSQYIEDSLKSEDMKLFQEFLDSYDRNPKDSEIDGLVNDVDVYSFYIKYRNEIDKILSDLKFYEKKPSEMDSFGLYDYVIKGTKEAISDVIKKIKEELSKQQSNQQTEEV